MTEKVVFEFEDGRKNENYSPSDNIKDFWKLIWDLAASYHRQGIKFKITYYEVKETVLWG